jgi:hypothetical protein
MMQFTPEKDAVIPVSAGIPPVVKWTAIGGVIAIVIVVGIAIGTSNYHHIWPAPDTTKIQLNAAK